MEIEGKLIHELPEISGTSQAGKEWKKREWVLETFDTQYPRKICFQAFGEERISRLNLEVGKSYAVSIDIESREWNGRWFTNISAYAAREISQPNPSQPQPQQFNAAPSMPQFGQQATAAPVADETDDLPF